MSRVLPKFYTPPQMAALVRLPDTVSRKGKRDRAILAVLLACGLRASELCSLRRRDVSSSLVFVRSGKFGHQRFVPISSRAWSAIIDYLASHPAGPDSRLFRTTGGNPLSRRLLHKLVTSYARRIGLHGGVHVLRHSAATFWLDRGIGLSSVRVMLGHVSISTTAIYLGTAVKTLVAEYRRCLEAPSRGGDPK